MSEETPPMPFQPQLVSISCMPLLLIYLYKFIFWRNHFYLRQLPNFTHIEKWAIWQDLVLFYVL